MFANHSIDISLDTARVNIIRWFKIVDDIGDFRGKLVKLPGREIRGDAGSNHVGGMIFSKVFLIV